MKSRETSQGRCAESGEQQEFCYLCEARGQERCGAHHRALCRLAGAWLRF